MAYAITLMQKVYVIYGIVTNSQVLYSRWNFIALQKSIHYS
jgi:hypothetical protein